jgi:hypothetical protein
MIIFYYISIHFDVTCMFLHTWQIKVKYIYIYIYIYIYYVQFMMLPPLNIKINLVKPLDNPLSLNLKIRTTNFELHSCKHCGK